MKIWAHCLVKNEDKFLWYSVISVIDHVDKVLLWDMNSQDNTAKIIDELKKIYPDKISTKKIGDLEAKDYFKVRQQMLNGTDADWFVVLDGDEVWWEESIKEVVSIIKDKKDSLDTIVSSYTNAIGDIFHYQNEIYGKYKIDGKVGNYTIRAINKNINGLHLGGEYPLEGYYNSDNILIQNLPSNRRVFAKNKYLHLTHLKRSSLPMSKDNTVKRKGKYKYEIGLDFPLDFYYPEAFFKQKPEFVETPWIKMDQSFKLKSLILDLPRKIKRSI